MLLGNGDGTFSAPYNPFNTSHSLSFYDADADGLEDVIYDQLNTDGIIEVWAFINSGDGTFLPVALTSLSFHLPSHDVDLDGDLDAFTHSGTELLWLELQADTVFNYHHIDSIPETWNTQAIHKLKTDLDQDGDIDLIVSSHFTEELVLRIYENIDSEFTLHEYLIDDAIGPEVITFGGTLPVLADINGNGFNDIHYIISSDDELVSGVYYNSGDLGALETIELSGPLSFLVNQWVDVDGDSDLDLLCSGGATGILGYGEPEGTVYWLPNDLINLGCGDAAACNYNVSATPDDNYCFYESGCPYENSQNYNENAQCISCEYVLGCMDQNGLNYNPDAQVLYYSECEYPSGCMSQCSNNYDPEALVDDGSCDDANVIYGCTQADAINFNTEADDCSWDNGTCIFEMTVHVFFDENENSILDTNEVMLPFQTVSMPNQNINLITDDFGQVSVVLADSVYNFTMALSENFPVFTTPSNISAEGSESDIYFGVSNEFGEFNVSVNYYASADGYPCDDEVYHNIFVSNEGHGMVSGQVELVYDELFQGYIQVDSISQVLENTLILEFDSLMPWQTEIYTVALVTPTVEHIGELLVSEVNVQTFIEGDSLVAQATDELSKPLTCAYDPNDKNGYPTGYTDEHFIENDQKIEYVIRFQNTGNAPATDIHVLDEFDVDLDLSTFKLVASSHSVQAQLNTSTREIDFFFDNIMLADSVNNEAESHGMVVFEISPHENLPVQTEINNTARIYFDNNPPIITNTTSHKIWGCELMTLEAGEQVIETCVGQEISILPITEYVEHYHWEVEGENWSESVLNLVIDELETIQAVVHYENPFCNTEKIFTIVVVGVNPEAPVVTENGFGLATDNDAAFDFQWFLDGEEIISGQQYFLNPSGMEGEYSVQITNENGCSSVSTPFAFTTGVFDHFVEDVKTYPNPSEDKITVEFSNKKITAAYIMNSAGSVVKSYRSLKSTNRLQVLKSDLGSGMFMLSLQASDGSVVRVKLIFI